MALDNQAHITWAANPEPDLAGYRVYWGFNPVTFSPFFSNSINVGNVLTYTISGSSPSQVTQDGKWYFAVTAYDTSNNESAFSTVVSKRIIRTLGHIKVVR